MARLCGIALFGAVLLLTATTTPHMAVIAGGVWLSLALAG